MDRSLPAGDAQGARVLRNICYQDIGPTNFYEERDVRPKSGEYTRPEHCKCNLNIFFDAGMPKRAEAFVAALQEQGLDRDSLVVDPMLADPADRGISPLEGSPAYGLGYKPIDVGKTGLTPSYPEYLRSKYSDFQISQE